MLALLIDLVVISAILQLLAMALFSRSHCQVQLESGLTSCERLQESGGVFAHANFRVGSFG
jgi:hypothetical protein